MSLISSYDVEVFSPPCDPGTERYAAKVKTPADLSPVLPYLNAVLRGAVYHKTTPALTWTRGGRRIVFHPHEIAINNLDDREQAEKEAAAVVEVVNRTWDRRAEITPDESTHEPPPALELYKHLPRTNCRDCGEPNCFVFALKLAAGQRSLDHCPPLQEPQYEAHRRALQTLLGRRRGSRKEGGTPWAMPPVRAMPPRP
ncbi:(Fe-S)-binding protein [Deferrisoma palaeochoriense]